VFGGFVVFGLLWGVDFWTKSFPAGIEWRWEMFKWIVNRTSKVAKMLVGIAAFLYVWLNGRRLAGRRGSGSL
jgi:hypothetical protein